MIEITKLQKSDRADWEKLARFRGFIRYDYSLE